MGGKKGKNIIYDDQGNLITTDDEKILLKIDNVLCEARKICKSGFLKSRKICLWRTTTFYETNKRLVFIRDPMTMIVCPPPPVGHIVPPVPIRGYENESDTKQFIQVQLNDIVSWKRGFLNGIRLNITDNLNKEYRILIGGVPKLKGSFFNDAPGER